MNPAPAAPRLKASLVPSITGVLLGPSGPRVTLVNISTTGALIEGRERLKPGDEVKLIFEGGFSPSVVASRVVRMSVAGIDPDGAIRFHVGLAFLSPIDLPAQADADPARPAPDGRAAAAECRQEIRNRW